MTTVLAGELPAEWFDRLPPRQLAASRESWRLSCFERSHPTGHPSRAVYLGSMLETIDSYTAEQSGYVTLRRNATPKDGAREPR